VALLRAVNGYFMAYPDDVGDLAQAHYGPIIEGDKPAESGDVPDLQQYSQRV
jgi:hypothetical protein